MDKVLQICIEALRAAEMRQGCTNHSHYAEILLRQVKDALFPQGDDKRIDEFETLVREERQRQEIKWGEQNHTPETWLAILSEEVGEFASSLLCNRWGYKKHRDKDLYSELIQVSAVSKAIYECAIRNRWYWQALKGEDDGK